MAQRATDKDFGWDKIIEKIVGLMGPIKGSLRHLENAVEELAEAEPDKDQLAIYLEKASKFMGLIEKGSKLYQTGLKVLTSFGITFS